MAADVASVYSMSDTIRRIGTIALVLSTGLPTVIPGVEGELHIF